ncbi:hypothetical protein RFI_05058, partial [Reticulomyxa filosa]
MSYKAFTCFSRLKSLEERILELLKGNNNDSTSHFQIFDNDEQEITNDQQLEIAFKTQPVFLFVDFVHSFVFIYDEKKNSEDEKKRDGCHKIMNPLVLLTGAAKYDSSDYLSGVKIDLMMFQNLFEEKYGYKVYCTYDPNKPETESLTSNQLDVFVKNHYSNLINTNNNKHNYDSLIFVWCGHGSTKDGEDVLITSDDEFKIFKNIQDLFTKVFVRKSKIFIKNACRGNEDPERVKRGTQQWYNKESDTLIIFPTTKNKQIYDSMGPGKGSYFTNYFYDVMTENISSPKPLTDILDKSTEPENKLWIKANSKAHKMVSEMINNKQQGIIVVSTNIDQLAKSNSQIYQQNIHFSMMINSNEYMKQKLTIGPYSICSFHSQNIVFVDITIDGCVYA